jgi:hypothetical protein
LADAAAALVFGFSFFGFLASRFPFGMAAAPSSGLSVAPIGEITSHPPKVIASDHLTPSRRDRNPGAVEPVLRDRRASQACLRPVRFSAFM